MGQFDTILWDVDDTLLDFKRSEDYALRETFQYFEIPLTRERLEKYLEINHGLWRQLEKGEVTNRDVLVGRFERLFSLYGITSITGEQMQAHYSESLGSVYFFLDDSYEFCKELHGKYRQYIVTNGAVVTQSKKLHLSGLDAFMEDIFISEQIEYNKPEKAYFDVCFAKIPKFDKKKTILVGDSLASDMRGGLTAGVTTCWYNPKGKENIQGIPVNYEIHALRQLRDILGGY